MIFGSSTSTVCLGVLCVCVDHFLRDFRKGTRMGWRSHLKICEFLPATQSKRNICFCGCCAVEQNLANLAIAL